MDRVGGGAGVVVESWWRWVSAPRARSGLLPVNPLNQ